MSSYWLLLACLALLALSSIAPSHAAFDLLAQSNAASLPSCGSYVDGQHSAREERVCTSLQALLAQSPLERDHLAHSTIQSSTLSKSSLRFVRLPAFDHANAHSLFPKKLIAHDTAMLLVLPQNARESQLIYFSIEESSSPVTATCSLDVHGDAKFGEWNRVVCSSTTGLIPVIDFNLHRIASLSAEMPYELIQLSLSDKCGDWLISSCSSSPSTNPSYIVSIVGQLSKSTGDHQVKAQGRTILSVQRAESSIDVSSPLLTIAATGVGSVVLVVAIVAMIASKTKSTGGGRSPTPPRVASVSPVASASNSPSSLSDGNVLAVGESGTPSSAYLAGGGATSSTLATSTSYSPTGLVGNGAASISPTVGRSMLSMSPTMVDTALQNNASLSARSNVTSPGRAQSSLSPQISARSSKSNPSASSTSRAVGTGVVSAATNQAGIQSNAAVGTTSKSSGIGAFFSKKKTERVAFLEPLISPKTRSWAPAVVANTSLASLPNEPVPKPKPRFLTSAQASTKVPNARRPVRYQDFVPSTSLNKYGTYSRAHSKQALQHSRSSTADDDLDFLDAAFGNSSKSLKTASGLPAVIMIGGVDSVLGDEDGPGGLFVYDDDDWLADVVEPDSDDPIYKNDTNYTHIDVDSLMPVNDALIDASVDLIEAHLSAIASPLTIPVAASTNEEMIEDLPKKKKKSKKSGVSSKRSKQAADTAEGSATAGAHSSSPSATVADISASPTSPSPPIAASDLTLSNEKVPLSDSSKAHSPRPAANPQRAPAPGTWRPSRNTPTIPLVSIASSRSAENISASSPNSSAPTSPVESEIKVRKHKDKTPREKEAAAPEDSALVVKKRSKKKRSTETTSGADLSEPTTTEESTTEPSTPREKKDKKDKEKKKRKRREKEEETNG